jgi:N-methylhydantoinase A
LVAGGAGAFGRRPQFDLSVFSPPPGRSLETARRGKRRVYFSGAWHDTSIWSRRDLPAGAVIEAPAVLEQPDATIFIDTGLRGRVDELGNVIVERIA